MNMLHQLWKDEAGFVVSMELILVATILVIGMLVGLVTVRNAVVQELGDVAMSIGRLNQTFYYTGAAGREGAQRFVVETAGSEFGDLTDFCDGGAGIDSPGSEPAGISVQRDPAPEEGLE